MHVLIIPGFVGFPEELTFRDLDHTLTAQGHTVTKLAWPHIPDEMDKYSFTATIAAAKQILKDIDPSQLIIIGSSMGGIIATILAAEFKPHKLILLVTPYQAGTQDDLQGKYKDWQTTGYREITSSKFGQLQIPFSFIEDARQYNALDYIHQVDCPILSIVAEKDDKVSRAASEELFAKAGEPKHWHLVPEMVHKYQYQSPEILEEVNRAIVDFVIA